MRFAIEALEDARRKAEAELARLQALTDAQKAAIADLQAALVRLTVPDLRGKAHACYIRANDPSPYCAACGKPVYRSMAEGGHETVPLVTLSGPRCMACGKRCTKGQKYCAP